MNGDSDGPTGGRQIIIVPGRKDRENDDYRTTYWPNFVDAVRSRLEGVGVDILVVDATPPEKPR